MRRRDFIAGVVSAGSAPAWSLAGWAQEDHSPIIGFLGFSPEPAALLDAFRAGLAEAGFVEGRNVSIEYRWASGSSPKLLAEMARDLVRRQAAVIVTAGAAGPAIAVRSFTSTIPIVFFFGADPVKLGLVDSVNRPGGNVTGVITLTSELLGKRLDLLLKLLPKARKVGFLSGTSSYLIYEQETNAIRAAGRALSVEIMIVECRDDRDYDEAMAKMVQAGVDGMILGSFALPNLDKVVQLAALHKLPAFDWSRERVVAGSLISYAINREAVWRRLGSGFVARILEGDKPANIPVELPTKFDLTLNLKTAKALGLTIPDSFWALVDEVIE